jgi:hypothetical protein
MSSIPLKGHPQIVNDAGSVNRMPKDTIKGASAENPLNECSQRAQKSTVYGNIMPLGYCVLAKGTLVSAAMSKTPHLSKVEVQRNPFIPKDDEVEIVKVMSAAKWSKQWRLALERKADNRLEEDSKRLRIASAKSMSTERTASAVAKRDARSTWVRATDIRLQERAAWEAGRKYREEQLQKERKRIAR